MTQSSKPTIEGLLTFYEEIINSFGLEVDEDSMIAMNLDGVKHPSMIKDKRMVLPTRDILRQSEWDKYVAFHPLSESMNRGESAMIKKLKVLVNFRLSFTISSLIDTLTQIAADKKYHEKLSPQQQQILEVMPRANNKTVESFGNVVDVASPTGEFQFVNVYLKHGGKFRGEDCFRVAVTTFPVLEHIDEDKKTIFNVKLSTKKDVRAFRDLFEYLLPNAGEPETYSYGSINKEAPYFDALMHAYIRVAKQLNKITWLFRRHIEMSDAIMINVNTWEDSLKDLAFYHGLIPPLPGNDGERGVAEKQKDAHATTTQVPGAQRVGARKGALSRMANEMESTAITGTTDGQEPLPSVDQAAAATPAANPSSGEGKVSWKNVMAAQSQRNLQPQQQMGHFPPQNAGFNNGWGPQAPFGGQPAAGTYANHPRNRQGGPNMGPNAFGNSFGTVFPGGI